MNSRICKSPGIRRISLIWLIAAVSMGTVSAGESIRKSDVSSPTVTANVSASSVHVAEPLTMDLTVVAAAGSKVEFPSIGTSLGKFDVTNMIDRADVPSADDVNRRIWTRRLTLDSIVTGNLEIPALEIQVRGGGEIQTLKTEVISVHVISVLEDRADPTKFRDIHSVVDVNVPQVASRAWLWWTLAGSGGIATALALTLVVAKRRTWMTPKVWAIRELDQLRHSEAMESSDSEAVTQSLTTIVRDYLELQFEIFAPVQTTNELLQVLETGEYMNSAVIKRFGALFENSDLARFAGVQLTPAELKQAIDDAQQLIEQTSSTLLSNATTAETAEVR